MKYYVVIDFDDAYGTKSIACFTKIADFITEDELQDKIDEVFRPMAYEAQFFDEDGIPYEMSASEYCYCKRITKEEFEEGIYEMDWRNFNFFLDNDEEE